MTNEEIYKLFRTQTKWVKFGDFLEHNIDWEYVEEELAVTKENFGELLIESAEQALEHAKRSDNES